MPERFTDRQITRLLPQPNFKYFACNFEDTLTTP